MRWSRVGSPGRSRAGGRGSICSGWSARPSARTAGRSLNRPVMCRRTGCSGCCAGRTGTSTRCVTTSGTMLSSHLGDPAGVLIIDETGFLKKGSRSAGVARQLYLPAAWTDDRDRRRAAGIPDKVGFATKVEMARTMRGRAFAAGVPAAWVTMDEGYGQSKSLRVWLEEHDQAYVVATRCNDSLLLALIAGAMRNGGWAACVGLPHLGLLAAIQEHGIAAERFALVPRPRPRLAAGRRGTHRRHRLYRSRRARPGRRQDGSNIAGPRPGEGLRSLPNHGQYRWRSWWST